MESSEDKVEFIQKVIKQFMEEEKETNTDSSSPSPSSPSSTIEENGFVPVVDDTKGKHDDDDDQDRPLLSKFLDQEIGKDEILNELKEIKKQNFVTHCLLSVMIVLTLSWQLSEVSMILKVKDGFSHPLRSVGRMILGLIRPRPKQSSIKQKLSEASSMAALKIQELPHVELPVFGEVGKQQQPSIMEKLGEVSSMAALKMSDVDSGY